MSDGNKRILGDVWINQENLDRQREFFRDIIESYQDKYGGEFDASTLQGLHASDFATSEQGLLAENALQDPLWLGKKRIANIEDRQYIWTDAIWMDRDISDTDSSSYRLANIDWFDDLPNDNLTDALVRIVDKVRETETTINTTINNKHDELDAKINDMKTILDDTTVEYIDDTTGTTTYGFNAQLVNGLRPILITEAEYNRLKTSEDENERNLISYWRNFFIFVDSLPVDYNQPWEYALTDPYSFRVQDGYLQVTNNIDSGWKNVASLEDLMSGSDLNTIIKNYVETSNNFYIGTTSLLNSLQLISTTAINENWESYPFLSSSLHDDFIRHLTLNGSNNYVTETVGSDKYKDVDIDMTQLLKDKQVLNSDGSVRINGMQSTISSHSSTISQLQNKVNSINNTINNTITPTNNTQTSDINSIKSDLTDIKNQLNSLSNNITYLRNGLGAWGTDYIRDTGNTRVTSQSIIYYNDTLRICTIYILGYVINHKGGQANNWERLTIFSPWPYRPKEVYHFASASLNMVCKIGTDGGIYIKHGSSSNVVGAMWASVTFNY